MRKLKALIAATAMVAALIPAAVATAVPHAPPDNFHTVCDVDGGVTLEDGLTNNRKSDHYTFIDAALECTTLDTAKAPEDYTGVYAVDAEGDTDDILHQGDGENCDEGGSASVGDEFHTGVLEAVRDGDAFQINGNVHFARLGTSVIADGPLTDENGNEGYFHAELQFVPNNTPPEDCTKANPITSADLIGEAVIDNGHVHDCLADADKKNDDHCN